MFRAHARAIAAALLALCLTAQCGTPAAPAIPAVPTPNPATASPPASAPALAATRTPDPPEMGAPTLAPPSAAPTATRPPIGGAECAGPDLCTVARAWTAAELRARQAAAGAPVWAEGDTLTFVYEGAADEVWMRGSIQLKMQPVAGSELWALTVRIRDLQRAVIGYSFQPYRDGLPVDVGFELGQWRGPEADPAPARAESLRGELRETTIRSAALGEERALTVYLPPGHDPAIPLPVVYLADGQLVPDYAAILEPLIESGAVPPVLLVGVHAGLNPPGSTAANNPYRDRRAQEYLAGISERRFAAHERFWIDEVLPWAERTLGAAPDRSRRAVAGVSNGAAFAIEMGRRHGDRFGAVLAFSFGYDEGLQPPAWAAGAAPRHYLVAGTLEDPFRQTTAAWADLLARAGLPYVYRERVSGHDIVMWAEELPGAIAWAFAAP